MVFEGLPGLEGFFFFVFLLTGKNNYIKSAFQRAHKSIHKSIHDAYKVLKAKKKRDTQKTTSMPHLELNQTIKSNNDNELTPKCTLTHSKTCK